MAHLGFKASTDNSSAEKPKVRTVDTGLTGDLVNVFAGAVTQQNAKESELISQIFLPLPFSLNLLLSSESEAQRLKLVSDINVRNLITSEL